MEPMKLQIRIVSLKDSAKQNVDNLSCYIKKLTRTPSIHDEPAILEPTLSAKTTVISINETFDWDIDEGNCCQIIFITSKSNPKAKADIILSFNHLVELVSDRKHDKDLHAELVCHTDLEQGYRLEFSIQKIEPSKALVPYAGTPKNHTNYSKISARQPIRGHLMKLKQFNQPVHCAICQGFIWGFHRQGFECTKCSLVTHRRCHQHVPFWCQKSSDPEQVPVNVNLRLKIHIPHSFKQYEAPLIRGIFTRNHGHCNHCGSQIIRNALKCTQCHFIIHEYCQSSLPPMCTISYNSASEIDFGEICAINARLHTCKTNMDDDKYSRTSSFDLSWLGPLPKFKKNKKESIPLPKFDDFQYVGRLGDGAFARVYCVQHIPSQQFLAMKVADGTNEQARQQLEVERQILFRYSDVNPYMIKAYCTFHCGSKLFLVMELVQGGSLYHKIQTTRMNEDEIRFYLAELICVVQYLHSKKIVYRDLKLEHAVVSTSGHIRLVDYGLGRILKTVDETCHTFCGTYSYMAPEVRRIENGDDKAGYSYPVDFWALGIMFVQMLCGEQLDFHVGMFSNPNEGGQEVQSTAEKLELPRHISPEAHSCVIGLLETSPAKRLGSPNSPHGLIRDHPFFKAGTKIDWQEIDEGLFKSMHRYPSVIHMLSDTSIHRPLSTLLLDRGDHGKEDWLAAGRTVCTTADDEQFKSFDYINQSAWLELIQLDSQ